MEDIDTGILIQKQNITLWRTWFKQMTRLHGVRMTYQAPNEAMKTYNGYGELETAYNEPIELLAIFDEHPTQKSMRKLGWNTEIADGNVVIHVQYDLAGLQAGGIFTIPAGLDSAEERRFRVIRLSNIAIYPASISCEIAPLFNDVGDKATVTDFTNSDFNLLADPEEE